MGNQTIPQINYRFVPPNGRNIFRDEFGSLSDGDWREVLTRSIDEPVINGVHFPKFPEDEFQNSVHGNHGATSIAEAISFYIFVRNNTYIDKTKSRGIRILDFGAGWGRIIRPFMRDFDFTDMYGFEPNFQSCAIARTLNPYVTFLSGVYTPTGSLPSQFFNLVFGWSIFSHLSEASATLWLTDIARIVVPGGWCVFTTWGDRFLRRLKDEARKRDEGQEIHWYSSVCIKAAGSLDQRIASYESGEFVWFTSGGSILYGEAFLGERALTNLINQHQLPFRIASFDVHSLPQDAFVLIRL